MAGVMSVAIESIAAGGDGVGRNEGLVVFVPRTAPGDIVTAQVAGKGHFARGSLRSVVTPSAQRVDPPCPHYTRDRCGGCQVQHMSYESQLAAKQRIIRDSVQRIGKRIIDLPDISPSPEEWRYRTKLTLALRRRGPHWIAGLHPYDDPGGVFALADCPITDRSVVTAWREIMSAEQHFPDARALRGSVRLTSGGPTFVMMGAQSWRAAESFADSVPGISALWWEPEDGTRRLLYDRRAEKTPSASFSQVNPRMAAELRSYVLALVAAHNPSTVIDGYAGTGELAVALAGAGARATAIELDEEASRWSTTMIASPSVALQGRVEDILPTVLPADVVVINPPRAGVDAAVAAALEVHAAAIRGVIYVSCNAATMARDLSRMPGFRIESVRAFDMFPQTAHVETVCELRPSSS